jgi:glycosyltransferase involved in cell wall biosynthesis
VTPDGAEREIGLGWRNRIDYLELCSLLPEADYVDFARVAAPPAPVRMLQSRSRIDFYYALQVARIARRENYQLVLSLSERVGIPLTCMLRPTVPHIVQLHHPLSKMKFRLVRALGVSSAWTHSVVYTRAEAEALRALPGSETNKIRHIQHPVDTRFYCPSHECGASAGQAISVGLSHRDYPTLLRALRKTPSVSCEIYAASSWVGGALDRDGGILPDNVRVRAYVHPRGLRARYNNCQFAIVTISKTTQWSAGVNAVLEAQAMALPVVATRTPGMTEYVLDGDTGVLVEPGDDVGLSQAMHDLAGNPGRARQMGLRARQWMEARFTLERWLLDYSRLLRGVEHRGPVSSSGARGG